MVDIQLQFSNGFEWYERAGIYVKGFLFDRKNKYYSGDKLVDYFFQLKNENDFKNKIEQANGIFSVVLTLNDRLFAAVDRLRSFPLFYYLKDGTLTISDSADWLRKYFEITDLAPSQMQEFRSSGFVSGDRTLIPGIFQIQTGAWLSFTGQDTKQTFYHQYYIRAAVEMDYEQAAVLLESKIRGSFSRFVESLDGRTVALSLSGGYDSRLIAVMLKELNYKNVLCYTFGRKNSPEIPLAKRTSEALNLPWIYIEHSPEFVGNYLEDSYFEDYFKFSANLTSMFFLESYFTLRHIRQNNLVPGDAIFTCGHSGDFLAGSQLVKNGGLREKATTKEISKQITNRKYSLLLFPASARDTLTKQIESQLALFTASSPNALAYSVFDHWDLKEKLAKFIFNSSNVYNFFGYQHRHPLMDIDLFDFFQTLPYYLKHRKKLYDSVLRESFFKPHQVDFKGVNEQTNYRLKVQKLKNTFRPFLGQTFQDRFKKKNDPTNYAEITDYLVKDMQHRGKEVDLTGKNYNSIIVQWYLDWIVNTV